MKKKKTASTVNEEEKKLLLLLVNSMRLNVFYIYAQETLTNQKHLLHTYAQETLTNQKRFLHEMLIAQRAPQVKHLNLLVFVCIFSHSSCI